VITINLQQIFIRTKNIVKAFQWCFFFSEKGNQKVFEHSTLGKCTLLICKVERDSWMNHFRKS